MRLRIGIAPPSRILDRLVCGRGGERTLSSPLKFIRENNWRINAQIGKNRDHSAILLKFV